MCSIVPPHLLSAIASSSECSTHSKTHASETLNHCRTYHTARLNASTQGTSTPRPHGGIIPSYLTQSIAESNQVASTARDSAARTLRQQTGDQKPLAPGAALGPVRQICDARHSSNERALPGLVIRTENQPSSSDFEKAANDTYDNLGRVFEFYAELFKRNSIDGEGLPLIGTIHFGTNYGNAFWDGKQMVFGDGDGELLFNFTGSLDVIGHELTHGVTEYTAKLNYEGQSGALNESVSDVFGECIMQYARKESAAEAGWLIGEDCILPTVKGVALRSMKAPGTAYNDKKFGQDPQPASMAGYVQTEEDNGGVHINSGIPNRAFYLAAVALGDNAWEKAAPIWYGTLMDGEMRPDVDFKAFAIITVKVAGELFGDKEAEVVRGAWKEVGVL